MSRIIQFKRPVDNTVERINYQVCNADQTLDIECSTYTLVSVIEMCVDTLKEEQLLPGERAVIQDCLGTIEDKIKALRLAMEVW